MRDTREKLSGQTVALHWIIALGFIATFAIGLAAGAFPRAQRAPVMMLHDSIGLAILVLAVWRSIVRLASGFPDYVGAYSSIEKLMAKAAHWALLAATLAVPLTGLIEPWARGQSVPFFGLFTLPPMLPQDRSLAHFGEELHESLAYIAAAIIVLHVVGALKHHLVDQDGTLRRMLGARVSVPS